MRLEEKVTELRAGIQQVNLVINDKAPHTRFDNTLENKHRQEWPILWNALDRLTKLG